MSDIETRLKAAIRAVPDFPKPGILFYDISTLLAHPAAWKVTVERLAEAIREANKERALVRHPPSERLVRRWIEEARALDIKISY